MPGDPFSGALIEIARDLHEKRVTAQELIEAAIARHQRFGERLHAYSLWSPEQARAVVAAADAACRRARLPRQGRGIRTLAREPHRPAGALVFKENRRAKGEFVGLGRELNLGDIACPTHLLVGAAITTPEQVLDTAKDLGTLTDQIIKKTVPGTYRPLL